MLAVLSGDGAKGVFLALALGVVLGVVAGVGFGDDVRANYIPGNVREHYRDRCTSMSQNCGGFCLWAQCTWCSDCSCVCCAHTRTNYGCYCSAPCECWEECSGEGEDEVCVEECDEPFLRTFQDCGPVCVQWKWNLYAGGQQPGRRDQDIENPFLVTGLGTALFARTQPYEGTNCHEEEVGLQTPDAGMGEAPEVGEARIGFSDDESMERPGSFPVDRYMPEAGATGVSAVAVAGREGYFNVSVSGGGGRELWRHWDAGVPVMPAEELPFSWLGGGVREVFLPRGWRAVQGAYVDTAGKPLGWSGVVVVWSGAPEAVSTDRVPRAATPTAQPTIEGVVRPGRPVLGEPFLNAARPGRVFFNVSSAPSGGHLRYQVWEATGAGPVRDWAVEGDGPFTGVDADWRTFTRQGGLLDLPNRGVIASGGGYMGVQVQARVWSSVAGEWVESRSSVIRYYWVEPDRGGWVSSQEDIGEFVWHGPAEPLFDRPEMTPVPTPEVGSLPVVPRLGQLRWLSTDANYVRLRIMNLNPGQAVQYRLWQTTGRAPTGAEARWRHRALVSGGGGAELRLAVGSRNTGRLQQWMSVQVRVGSGGLVGNGSEVLEFRLEEPLVPGL